LNGDLKFTIKNELIKKPLMVESGNGIRIIRSGI